jgi:hypothetical protein
MRSGAVSSRIKCFGNTTNSPHLQCCLCMASVPASQDSMCQKSSALTRAVPAGHEHGHQHHAQQRQDVGRRQQRLRRRVGRLRLLLGSTGGPVVRRPPVDVGVQRLLQNEVRLVRTAAPVRLRLHTVMLCVCREAWQRRPLLHKTCSSIVLLTFAMPAMLVRRRYADATQVRSCSCCRRRIAWGPRRRSCMIHVLMLPEAGGQTSAGQ